MEQKQQTEQSPMIETSVLQRTVEQPVQPRRLRIDRLEERVAPIAIWAD